jgi:hypothetical protein
MTYWTKPSFEELAMNAEIGAYQPEDWEGERYDVPFVNLANQRTLTSSLSPAHGSPPVDVTISAGHV